MLRVNFRMQSMHQPTLAKDLGLIPN
ncbi:hypothetical protein MPC4_110136 [Methylocella tundrae]|uniref:Uncharacterized protein n=1 Tax=Methylocella tundrae TaxID=227605 RepID=A0A8B6M1X0_METTU|nr:hypothetical protein MPC1_4240005 [Methylocella tundrae]VTZ48836.1 hypothetical protein MPC4_110136 [Methylocella tundrae]